jgi:hypothetical protein
MAGREGPFPTRPVSAAEVSGVKAERELRPAAQGLILQRQGWLPPPRRSESYDIHYVEIHMKSFVLMMLFGLAGCWAADNPVVGKWDCTSNDGTGQELTWTLVVKEDGGKLSGSLIGGLGAVDLIEPRLEGNTFTFKIYVNANCTAEAKLKVEGKKMDGKFGCAEASGSFKGAKQS